MALSKQSSIAWFKSSCSQLKINVLEGWMLSASARYVYDDKVLNAASSLMCY